MREGLLVGLCYSGRYPYQDSKYGAIYLCTRFIPSQYAWLTGQRGITVLVCYKAQNISLKIAKFKVTLLPSAIYVQNIKQTQMQKKNDYRLTKIKLGVIFRHFLRTFVSIQRVGHVQQFFVGHKIDFSNYENKKKSRKNVYMDSNESVQEVFLLHGNLYREKV